MDASGDAYDHHIKNISVCDICFTNQRIRVIVDLKSDYHRSTLRAEHVFQLAIHWVKGIISTILINNEKYMVLSFISQGCLETGNSCKLENSQQRHGNSHYGFLTFWHGICYYSQHHN
jgi:hypothetical protein